MRTLGGVMFLVALFAGPAWAAWGTADSTLAKLGCVEVLTYVSPGFNLTSLEVSNALFVAARAKLPRLRVESSACPLSDRLALTVTLSTTKSRGGQVLGYHGSVSLRALRLALIVVTSEGHLLEVWREEGLIAGPPETANEGVHRAIDSLVTQFAAAYYKAGNE